MWSSSRGKLSTKSWILQGLRDEQADEHGSFFKFPEEMVVQCEIENSAWVFIVVEPATRIIKKKGLLLQTHSFNFNLFL